MTSFSSRKGLTLELTHTLADLGLARGQRRGNDPVVEKRETKKGLRYSLCAQMEERQTPAFERSGWFGVARARRGGLWWSVLSEVPTVVVVGEGYSGREREGSSQMLIERGICRGVPKIGLEISKKCCSVLQCLTVREEREGGRVT